MDKSLKDILNYLDFIKTSTLVDLEIIPFKKATDWLFDPVSQNYRHKNGSFFSIDGIRVSTNSKHIQNWEQPIINQNEVGILGILVKFFDGVPYLLMQAKIEPGNLNYVQISPTLQATRSNFTRKHLGKTPLYLEYFLNRKGNIIVDQLQSEQGARFRKKRNRNMVIEIKEEIKIHDNFFWITIDQLMSLLELDNTVNMDTRSVLSQFLFFTNNYKENFHLNEFKDIVHWITNLKFKYNLNVQDIPINSISQWKIDEFKIYHTTNKFFEVLPVQVNIEGREVSKWNQPMIKALETGLCAIIIKRINDVYHLLLQGKVECGNFDIVEIAPTVQCLTGSFNNVESKNLPFLSYVLNSKKENIIYDVMQSEEGGRFYREQNRNMIIIAEDSFSLDIPENYFWISLKQTKALILFNNYINIQARSLIAYFVNKEHIYG